MNNKSIKRSQQQQKRPLSLLCGAGGSGTYSNNLNNAGHQSAGGMTTAAEDVQYVLLLSKSTRRSGGELFFLNSSNFLLEMTLRRVFKGKGGRARMPAAETDDIRVKIVYNGEVQITYITSDISVDKLREEMRTICGFGATGPAPDQFTMKWVDDEGDPCRIASQQELDEALRLYELDKDTEITIHGKSSLFLMKMDFISGLRETFKGIGNLFKI